MLLEQSVLLHLAEHSPQISSLSGQCHSNLLLLQAIAVKLLIAAYAKLGVSLSFNLKCCSFGCGERQLLCWGCVCTSFGGRQEFCLLVLVFWPGVSEIRVNGMMWSTKSCWGHSVCYWAERCAGVVLGVWAPVQREHCLPGNMQISLLCETSWGWAWTRPE